jgi:SNF family Na+-dependent transporter
LASGALGVNTETVSNTTQAWGGRLGVILAVTGSAVGLGNFLRFPGLAAKYEGGAFMVPYFISLILLGLPLAWAEWSMGRRGGTAGYHSCPGIFRVLWSWKGAPYAGVFGLIVPVMIYMYYVLIESWCLGYAWKYLSGAMDLGQDPAAYGALFQTWTGLSADGALLQGVGAPLVCLGLCVLLNFFLIYRGLSKGIELFCLWAMPVLVGCALIVLVRVLTLGTPDPARPELNVLNGLGFMWNPRTETTGFFEALLNGKMWMEAASQIFFSLSVGFGVVITYASYLRHSDDIALSSTTSVAGNEFCEVSLGGMITIPAAFVFLGVAGTVGGTFALGFHTLPLVFERMPAGQFFGFLWFFLLFLAAVTSSISMLQPAIAFFEEGLGLTRSKSVLLLAAITLTGTAFVFYFSEGLAALDTIDFWVGTFCIFLLAAIQCMIFAWIWGTKRGMEELERGALLRIPGWFPFVIKYVSPAYLLAIFGVWAYQNVGGYVESFRNPDNTVVRWSVGFILLNVLLFLGLIHRAVKRWDEASLREAP